MIRTVLILLFLVGINSVALAERVPKPWVKFSHDSKSDTDFYYNPKEINRDKNYIEVNVLSIMNPKDIITYKHIKFDLTTGFRGYGDVSMYKGGTDNLINKFDFSSGGYVYSRPDTEEKSLFKKIR